MNAPRCCAWSVATMLAAQPACADDRVAAFYTGKTITIITSTGPGGLYDLTARVLGRHMPRHMPDSRASASMRQSSPG